MYTQCPHCQTIFGVSEAHLSAAFGRVRCGHCQSQFNAKRHLLDDIPTQPEAESVPSTEPEVDQGPSADAALALEPMDIELAPMEALPEEEIDYIDLSDDIDAAHDETEHEIAIDLDAEKPQDATVESASLNDISLDMELVELPVVEDNASREELDAIFADLDQRLEQLSGNTDEDIIRPHEEFVTGNIDHRSFNEAFGDPESQTEDDIRASIETIFAAAEAELIKTDTLDEADREAFGQELYLNEFLDDKAGFDLPDTEQDDMAPEPDTDTPIPVVAEEPAPLAYEEEEQTRAEDIDEPDSLPSFTQEELPFALHDAHEVDIVPARSGKMLALLSGTIVLLCLAAVFQLALFRNIELANKIPALKPWLTRFCQHLPCQFSGQRDVQQIYLTSRDVRSHPDGKNTILINAIFVNKASFEQPYPDIVITLSDLTTTVVSQRRFTPAEYLNQQQGVFQLMKPGKPVHISLEVLDPGNDAVNFQFDFL